MQQQFVDWSAVRSLPLHALTTRKQSRAVSRHLSLIALTAGYQRGAQAACQASKQRGSTYYERYLRNRKAQGGEFIGPPRGPLLLQQAHQLELQQQQQQHDPTTPDPPTSSTAGQVDVSLSPGQLSVLTPLGFKQLLDQCLLATAPSPVGLVKVLNPTHSQHPEAQGLEQLGTHQGLRAQGAGAVNTTQQQKQQQQQQWLREPWTFKDYVAEGNTHDDVTQQSVRRKRGLTVQAPVVTTRPPLMPLPPIPSRHSSSSSSGSGSSSGSSTARKRVLHVFWDISSIHPGGDDPRVIVAQLKRVCSAYGLLHGIYAYGVQKQFSWVPEAFLLQYAPGRLPGRRQRQQQQQSAPQQQQQQQQQRQLESKLAMLAAAGIDLDEQLGPLRCPACGKLRSNYAQLHLHMVQRHKQPAPPLFKLLPDGALDVLLRQAGAQGGGANQQQQQQQLEGWTRVGVNTGSSSGAKPNLFGQLDAMTMQNNSTRTLGRVTRYYNSAGAQFEPPLGHQISLKYVLLREGVDIRLVQNQKRAVDVSLAEGLSQLLQQLLQKDADWMQQYDDTVVVLSDRGTHVSVLERFQKAGFSVVAVCRRIRKPKGADVTLRWSWVVDGRYECGDTIGM